MTPLVLSLFALLRAKQYIPLHAAALEKDGRGMLLVAPGGSGKSTLSLGLVQAGWKYISDDAGLLHKQNERIHVHTFRRNFALYPHAQKQFPEISLAWDIQLTNQQKRMISIAQLFPDQEQTRCAPEVIVFPTIYDESISRLEPSVKRDALLGLMEQSPLLALHTPEASLHLSILKELVNQTSHYSLFAGHELRDSPAMVASLLEPILTNMNYASAN